MLDQKEEAKFAELKDKCRELKVLAPPEIMIEVQVHEDGVLTFDDVQRGHSWNRNYYNLLGFTQCAIAPTDATTFGAGHMNMRDISGWNLTANPIGMGYVGQGLRVVLGGVSSSTTGIIVGTGDTAFSADQYNLVSQIVQGTAAGQFSHAAQSAFSAVYSSKVWTTTFNRIFNNNSGGSITVKEVGLRAEASGYSALIERSVLSSTVAVPNGAQLTVTYEISMDFSAID